MFSTFQEMASWALREWRIALPLAGGLGAYALLTGKGLKARLGGWIVALVSLFVGWACLARPTGDWVMSLCFFVFAALALGSAIAVIVHANPVYAALHFAIVILSACGLYLLQAAAFLAAATVIVYAGAIIVTFLFVIMLAHQSGRSTYDLNPRQPVLVGVAGVFLLGALLATIEDSFTAKGDNVATIASKTTIEPAPAIAAKASLLSRPTDASGGGVLDLGRTLFSDYLWATELAGTILLVSTIGAIAIAAHRKGAIA